MNPENYKKDFEDRLYDKLHTLYHSPGSAGIDKAEILVIFSLSLFDIVLNEMIEDEKLINLKIQDER